MNNIESGRSASAGVASTGPRASSRSPGVRCSTLALLVALCGALSMIGAGVIGAATAGASAVHARMPAVAGGWSSLDPIDPVSGSVSGVSCASSSFCVAVDSIGNVVTSDGTSWSSPDPVDAGAYLYSASCPTTSFCVVADLSGNVLTYDGTDWTAPDPIDSANSIPSVSCPSSSFCAAVDSAGNALTFDGTSWSAPDSIDPGAILSSVSCPSSAFCAAVDEDGNALTFDGTSWSAPDSIDPGGAALFSVSCASSSFCAAVDSAGNVLTFDGTSWSAPEAIDPSGYGSYSVSCVTSSFCASVDIFGRALTYDGTSWSSPTLIEPNGYLDSVSCPSTSFCAAVNFTGDVITYDGTTWSSPSSIDPVGGLNSVSCPSTSFCATVDGSGSALTYDGTSWTSPTPIDPGVSLSSVSCPSSAFCSVVDQRGSAFTYDGTSWSTSTAIDPGGSPTSVSCPSSSFCAAVDGSGNAVMYDGTSWSVPVAVDPDEHLFSVSCPSSSFCAAVDGAGNAVMYDGTSWSAPVQVDGGNELVSVSCPSGAFCAAVTFSGDVVTYDGTSWSAPTGIGEGDGLSSVACASSTSCTAVSVVGVALSFDGTSWSSASQIDDNGGLSSISCPDTTFCAAVDHGGDALTYGPPPAPTITSVTPDQGSTYGGDSVAVDGTDLGSTSEVDFGGVAATIVSTSDTEVDVTTPPGTAGPVDVTVTTSGGSATDPGAFTYLTPQPPTATISSPADASSFALDQPVATSFSCAESAGGPGLTSCTDSNGASGGTGALDTSSLGTFTYTVTATSGDGQTGEASITYQVVPAPTLTSITPNSGSTAGGTDVVLIGTNLENATQVLFGGGAGTITFDSDTEIDVTSPPEGAEQVQVVVITPGGSYNWSGGFTYVAPSDPSATIASPADGGAYALDQVVPTSFSCAEGAYGPGLTGCVDSNGSTSGTGQLVTSSIGSFTYTVTATSGDGQTGTASIGYTVVPAPSLTGLSPVAGSTAGGTTVTLTGTDLDGASAVDFGPDPATIVTDTSTSVTVTTPAEPAGPVVVTLTTPGGTSTSPVPYSFVAPVDPAATIASPASGGTYTVGQVVPTSFSCTEGAYGPGLASCTDSNGASGGTGALDTTAAGTFTYTVTATSGDGLTGTASISYTVLAVPAITSVAPATGTTLGGTSVTITGANLDGASAVDFGTVAGTVTADTSTSISVTTPAEAAGTVDVSVTTPGGTATHPGSFTFVSPSAPSAMISSPDSGGSYTVGQVVATSFGCTEGTFGPGLASCTDSNGASGGTGALDTTAAGTFTYTVTATSGDGLTGTASITYTVVPTPVVTALAPATGSTAGGTTVTLTGTGLTGASAVSFGAAAGTIVTDTDTSLTVTTPAEAPGAVSVTVTTPGGTATSPEGFTFVTPSAPSATIASPASGGSYALGQAVATSFSCAEGTYGPGLTACTDSNGVSGGTGALDTSTLGTFTYTVTATSGDGQTGTASLTYSVLAAPAVTSLAPSSGPAAGGTTVTLTGTGLAGASAVSFGSVAATVVTDTDTSLTVTAPAEAAGTVDVTVTTPYGTSATSGADQFTYVAGGVAPGPYTPLAPTRVCDTRAANPSQLSGTAAQCNGKTLAAGSTLDFSVASGTSGFGVPADASAVVLNVTATGASTSGYVTVFPAGTPAPTASSLNVTAAGSVANLVEVGLGTGSEAGEVSAFASTGTDLVVNLEGYVAATTPAGAGAGLYQPLATPTRICDTRAGNPSGLTGPAQQCDGETLAPGATLAVTVTGSALDSVPADATAVVVNVTAIDPDAQGFFTVWPAGSARPTASNLNYRQNQVVPNRVIVPVGTNGQIDLYSLSGADAAIDLSGWFSAPGGTGAEFVPEATPTRICDTRAGNPSQLSGTAAQCNGQSIGAGQTLTVTVSGSFDQVPADASAVVLNVTAVHPSAQTYLTVFPSGTPPTASDLNPAPGSVEPNLVVATVSDGTVRIFNHSGTTDVVVDVAGWYQ